jgi:hypothetical protein
MSHPRRRAGAFLPESVSTDGPLYLSPEVRRRVGRRFDSKGIFLNIPYGARYSSLEVAILATVTAYGMHPHMARERMRMQVRMLKIVELMLECRYGLTDLSYVTRMNMPLELGLLLAFDKETFVMSGRRYSGLKSVSDLNFCDIHYHERSIRRLVGGLSRWVEEVCGGRHISNGALLRRYRHWKLIQRSIGPDFDRYTPEQISRMVATLERRFRMRMDVSR